MPEAIKEAVITNEQTLKEFLRIHYSTSNGYTGKAHIWYRRIGESSYHYLFHKPVDELDDAFKDFEFRKMDYCISANAFRGYHRQKESLFTLQNITLDIDVHDMGLTTLQRQGKIYAVTERLLNAVSREEIPAPNTVVWSGRGVQVWWTLVPASYKLLGLYESIRDGLIKKVDALIEDIGCVVDPVATKNAAGVFRLPGTYNTVAERWGSFRIYHNKQLDLIRLANVKSKITVKKNPWPYVSSGGNPNYSSANERETALLNLIGFRQENGTARPGSENRDIVLFNVYCIWSKILSHEDIMQRLYRINEMFIVPMRKKEIDAYMSSARKVQYTITNRKLIEKLKITPEEQAEIGLFVATRDISRKQRREEKEQRNRRIVELHEQGTPQQEIADEVGCSRRTVINVLHKECVSSKPNKDRAKVLQVKGMSNKEIAKALGVSERTIRRYLGAA